VSIDETSESAAAVLSDEAPSPLPEDDEDLGFWGPAMRRRRRTIAVSLILVLAATIVSLIAFGPPSFGASGSCGGG
jgi:hypothetical protein